jgi:hypothetical protein
MALPAAATHGPTPDLSAYWERPKSLIRRTIPSKCPVPNKPKPANPSLFIHSPADAFGFSGTDYRLFRNAQISEPIVFTSYSRFNTARNSLTLYN